MSGGDKAWAHRAFPTLPPAEAEGIAEGLGEIAGHRLRDLTEGPDPDGLRSALAEAYSGIIADLMAERSRKADAHRRRWLAWQLSRGDLGRNDVGKTVTRWLDAHPQLCGTFGFPAGDAERKRRSAILKDLLAEMRAAVRDGARPFTLSKLDQDRLEDVMSFTSMEEK